MRTSSQLLSAGLGSLVLSLAGVSASTQSQDVAQITIGGVGATRVAIAPCSAMAEPMRLSCGIVREVLKADLDFEGFQLTPESLMRSLPLVDPRVPNFVDWKSVGANVLTDRKSVV